MTVAIETTDNVYQRVNKLLPADATGAFLAVQAIIRQLQAQDAHNAAILTIGAILVIAFILPFYARRLLGVTNIIQVSFLTVTFVLWALWLSEIHIDELFGNTTIMYAILQILVVIWTFFVSPFVSGLDQPKQTTLVTPPTPPGD